MITTACVNIGARLSDWEAGGGRAGTMTYSYGDAKGYLTYGPSIGGAKALLDELDVLGKNNYPELSKFLKSGIHENPKVLAVECRRLYRKLALGPVRHTVGRPINHDVLDLMDVGAHGVAPILRE